SSPTNVTLSRVEVGPTCCNSDGIVLGKGDDTPNPSNVTLDHVYVHDITDNCANYPEADCSRYAPASLDEFHDDCLQAYGGEHITITSSRFYNCATQGIFAGNASGGTFADWTIENTMVGGIPGGQSNHAIIFGGGWAPGDP